MIRVVVAAAVVALALAPVARADSDGAYVGHLDERHVPTGITNGTVGAKLGHAVCGDMKNGTPADTLVMQVANLTPSGTAAEAW